MLTISSCGNKQNLPSNSEEQEKTEVDNQVMTKTEEPVIDEAKEPELLETYFSFIKKERLSFYESVKDIIRKKRPDRHGWEFDDYCSHFFNIEMNYDDGSASAIAFRQIYVKHNLGNFKVNCDSVYYVGFWKSRTVQRGNKYIEAYEFQLSKDNEKTNGSDDDQRLLLLYYPDHISIYTTEKFDFAYVGWGEDEDIRAFHSFSDGIKSQSQEIFNLKHTWNK